MSGPVARADPSADDETRVTLLAQAMGSLIAIAPMRVLVERCAEAFEVVPDSGDTLPFHTAHAAVATHAHGSAAMWCKVAGVTLEDADLACIEQSITGWRNKVVVPIVKDAIVSFVRSQLHAAKRPDAEITKRVKSGQYYLHVRLRPAHEGLLHCWIPHLFPKQAALAAPVPAAGELTRVQASLMQRLVTHPAATSAELQSLVDRKRTWASVVAELCAAAATSDALPAAAPAQAGLGRGGSGGAASSNAAVLPMTEADSVGRGGSGSADHDNGGVEGGDGAAGRGSTGAEEAGDSHANDAVPGGLNASSKEVAESGSAGAGDSSNIGIGMKRSLSAGAKPPAKRRCGIAAAAASRPSLSHASAAMSSCESTARAAELAVTPAPPHATSAQPDAAEEPAPEFGGVCSEVQRVTAALSAPFIATSIAADAGLRMEAAAVDEFMGVGDSYVPVSADATHVGRLHDGSTVGASTAAAVSASLSHTGEAALAAAAPARIAVVAAVAPPSAQEPASISSALPCMTFAQQLGAVLTEVKAIVARVDALYSAFADVSVANAMASEAAPVRDRFCAGDRSYVARSSAAAAIATARASNAAAIASESSPVEAAAIGGCVCLSDPYMSVSAASTHVASLPGGSTIGAPTATATPPHTGEAALAAAVRARMAVIAAVAQPPAPEPASRSSALPSINLAHLRELLMASANAWPDAVGPTALTSAVIPTADRAAVEEVR
jgi:hypothetical protein